MAHITLQQLTTVLERIVSWAVGNFAAKNTVSGKLDYADMPVVVLASMGAELDGTSTGNQMSAGSTYFAPAGPGISARINLLTSSGQHIKISDPESNVIYCNSYTGLLYRWEPTTSRMVPVGGGTGDIDLSGYYTSTEVDGLLSSKANSSDVANTYATKSEMTSGLSGKQNVLRSGENIKTINNIPILGSGDISIPAGKSAYQSYVETTSDNPVLTEAQWTQRLMRSAYLSYLATTSDNPVKSEAEWVASLQGPQGNTLLVDGNTDVISLIVNNLTTGGAGNILSAAMGALLKSNFEILVNAIGEYAFPNGRPIFSWQGTLRTITQTLTRVTSDCDIATIADGSQLTIHLTPNLGCTLDSVVVMMGITDVTSVYYDSETGTITIPIITGDIVITAVATLPYDAEIEYLEANGTQYFDTGLYGSLNFRCEIKAQYTAVTGQNPLLGAERLNASSEGDSKWFVPLASLAVAGTEAFAQFSGQYTKVACNMLGLHVYQSGYSGDTMYVTADGVSGTRERSGTPCTSVSLAMFGRKRSDGTFNAFASARIYYCKIWEGDTLVADFIPVRVGTEGKMYNRVNGQFFSNEGTGDFILGNDLTE